MQLFLERDTTYCSNQSMFEFMSVHSKLVLDDSRPQLDNSRSRIYTIRQLYH